MSGVTAFAPGRVNAMGDHIDYLGGWVLPLALPLGTTCRMRAIDGDQHRAQSESHGTATWALGQADTPSGQWYDYLMGALASLDRAVEIQLSSDLPQGSGCRPALHCW